MMASESPAAVFPCMAAPSAEPIMFAVAFETLAKAFAALRFPKATSAAGVLEINSPIALLLRVEKAVMLVAALTQMTKRNPKRAALLATIKYGRVFVDAFLKAMPFLGAQLRVKVRSDSHALAASLW